MKYLWLAPLVVVLVLIILLASSCVVRVAPGEKAVVYNLLEREYSRPLDPGIHFILPLVYQITLYSVRDLAYTMSDSSINGQPPQRDALEVLSSDGLLLKIELSLDYHPDASRLTELHEEIGPNYEDKIIRPTARKVLRNVFSEYSAVEAYANLGPSRLSERLYSELAEELSTYHIVLDEVQIRDIQLPQAVLEAIEQQKAEQALKVLGEYEDVTGEQPES